MKFRGLIVAAILLAALAGTLYWSNHHKSTAKSSSDIPPKILSLQEADINSIVIQKKDADEVHLQKNGNDWQITAPQPMPADQSAVSGLASALATLDSQRVVDDKASDLQPYGLSDPGLSLAVTAKDNKTRRVLVGDATPTGNGVYAKIASDPRVFTIASFTKTSLDKNLNDLRDKRLITAEPDKISRLDLMQKSGNIQFGRGKDQWEILQPNPMRADGSKVDDLVRTVTEAKMDLGSNDDPKQDQASFASGIPVASVKLTTDSGTQELQLRKKKDAYYAKTSILSGAYKVSSSLDQELDKKLDDFRNKKLFDFGFNQPSKIEVHDGAKAYFLTRNKDDWWSGDGKQLDGATVNSLVGDLRDLEASKFVRSGFGNAVISITVTSNDGKRTEKVLISKSAGTKDYVAERANEPTLYVLSESAVADLQKAVEAVKPAAPSKK